MEIYSLIPFDGRIFTFRNFTKKVLGISNKMFTQTVRELERDGLVIRKVYPVVPPKIEYALSEKGNSLNDILKSLDVWGVNDYALIKA